MSSFNLHYSLSQLTSHRWPSFGNGENKGSVLLWYSYCFDCSILMFLIRQGLQSRISILKHCLILSLNWRHIHWPSFGKGENKGTVLLWYSCFDRSILMFQMRDGLQCRVSILKHCLMKLWNDINQLTFIFPFAETRSIDVSWPRKWGCESISINWLLFSPLPKLGQLTSIDRENRFTTFHFISEA